jgi:hypothetical protein
MTVVYVQNRLPHSALGLKTPEEMFTGKKLEVSHLKIFGCPVFIHIPKEKRNKLEPSRKKGIFVGYYEVSKAFRIYIPGHRHIEISRDVTFDEEAALKKSQDDRVREGSSQSCSLEIQSDSPLQRSTCLHQSMKCPAL